MPRSERTNFFLDVTLTKSFLNEMAGVAAYFELDGQIRAKYDDVDASEYFI